MENEFNPWKVTSLEDFTMIVYSCPECERIFSTSEQFIGHAMMSHPKARDTLPDILNIQDEEVKEESDLESLEIKSDITEKSLVIQDCVEVEQESEIEVVEIIVGSRGATPDILNFTCPGAKSTFNKKRKAEDNGYEDAEEEEFWANKKPKMGLSSTKCPDKAEGNVHGGCKWPEHCGKYGHFFRKCTEPRLCFNCGKPGHMSKECTETAGSNPKMLCNNCNTVGHTARFCDKPRIERSGFGKIPKIF